MLKVLEDQFLRPNPATGLMRNPEDTEVVLFLKFLHTTISRLPNTQESQSLLNGDPRVAFLIDMLASRYSSMNLELKMSAVYSLGYFFSSCGYHLRVKEHYAHFVKPLVDADFPKEAI